MEGGILENFATSGQLPYIWPDIRDGGIHRSIFIERDYAALSLMFIQDNFAGNPKSRVDVTFMRLKCSQYLFNISSVNTLSV